MKDLTPASSLDPIELASAMKSAPLQAGAALKKNHCNHALCGTSPFYRQSFDTAGVHPERTYTACRDCKVSPSPFKTIYAIITYLAFVAVPTRTSWRASMRSSGNDGPATGSCGYTKTTSPIGRLSWGGPCGAAGASKPALLATNAYGMGCLRAG